MSADELNQFGELRPQPLKSWFRPSPIGGMKTLLEQHGTARIQRGHGARVTDRPTPRRPRERIDLVFKIRQIGQRPPPAAIDHVARNIDRCFLPHGHAPCRHA